MRSWEYFNAASKRALRDASGLRGDADAPAIQRRERYFVAFAFVADAIRYRHHAIVENQFTARGCTDTQFFFFLADFESRRPLFDD